MPVAKRPHANEESYFQEQERKLIEKLREEREQRIREEEAQEKAAERDRLKKLHWMSCPKCGHGMEERELSGIQVDVCTHCEGIFFDRGELEDLFLKQQAKQRTGFFRKILGLGE
jgi:hypothetical protein